MKNLKHLLVALLVMGAIGCTTDTVENEINPMQGTTILNVDIPNPQTKVGLGEKGEDGKYPMHWCSGDKISVNGNISEEAVINPDNTCSAQFEFKSAVLIRTMFYIRHLRMARSSLLLHKTMWRVHLSRERLLSMA